MDPICTAALAALRHQEAEYRTVITGLSEDALNWKPGPDTNSIAVLVTHAWGAAQAWTARARGNEVTRDRAAEFRVAMTAHRLFALLDQASVTVAEHVTAIDPTTYGDDRVDPNGDHFTVASCLIHAIEHTQEHLGQAYVTRQLWEQQHR